jgi:uncharacterized iron-regulated membrane protein
VARAPFPRAELRRVTTPAGNSGIYRINLRQSNEINQRHPYTTVWIDRWSGQAKEVRNPATFTWGETFTTWIWPIHTGEALGTIGRFLWFIAGIGLFVLYISGLLQWLYRSGKIKDQAVNLAALRPAFYRLGNMAYRTAVMLFRLALMSSQKAKQYAPHVLKTCMTLLQRLKLVMLSSTLSD